SMICRMPRGGALGRSISERGARGSIGGKSSGRTGRGDSPASASRGEGSDEESCGDVIRGFLATSTVILLCGIHPRESVALPLPSGTIADVDATHGLSASARRRLGNSPNNLT